MNATKQTHPELIRELIIRCLIDYPNDLRIELRESRSMVFWTIQCHADDYRKICGAKGAHIKALTYLIEELGAVEGIDYRVWLKEPEVGEVRPMRIVDARDEYDAREAAEVLGRAIAACVGIPNAVAIETRSDGTRIETPPFAIVFTFHLFPKDAEIASEISEPYENDPDERTLVGSLAALWKAYGAKNGVSFALKVEPPRP